MLRSSDDNCVYLVPIAAPYQILGVALHSRARPGYLPCKLGSDDCGFEYYLDELESNFRETLDETKRLEWNSALTLVTRGGHLDGRVAAIAAVAFAQAVGGGIVEEDDEIVEASGFSAWLDGTLKLLDVAEEEVRQADAWREATQAAGPRSELECAVSGLAGKRALLSTRMGFLGPRVGSDCQISSSAWRVEMADRGFDNTRYALLRERQMALLGDDQSDAEIEQLFDRMDEAGALDENDANALGEALASLGEVSILAAEMPADGHLLLELDAGQQIVAHWYGMGTSSISFKANGLEWHMRKDDVSLL